MNTTAKEFLTLAINDYNKIFKTNFSINGTDFQNYYRDLANRVKKQEIDLLIVVGMFLSGFDAPTLNTLFVDKNLRYHGLIQAFLRTNRIYTSTKSFGNIVTFRDLEKATIDAITLFGKSSTKNVILEKSYEEYMNGFKDSATGEDKKGYLKVIEELKNRFPTVDNIVDEKDKKEFVKLFGEYLKVENILQNYDEFTKLKAVQKLDIEDKEAVKEFEKCYYISEEEIRKLKEIEIPSEREIQDYCSTYNDIREWLRRENENKAKENTTVDWSDVVFEVDLLKSQEIDLTYILELIFEKNKNLNSKEMLIEDVRRLIRASIGNRAKESLIIDFINNTDLSRFEDKASIIEALFIFAKDERVKEEKRLIEEENLNSEVAKRYISCSLRREFASENGIELNELMPKMSPLNPNYLPKKKSIFEKISAFVEKFKGIGKKDS